MRLARSARENAVPVADLLRGHAKMRLTGHNGRGSEEQEGGVDGLFVPVTPRCPKRNSIRSLRVTASRVC
jgi:hypothetical protein